MKFANAFAVAVVLLLLIVTLVSSAEEEASEKQSDVGRAHAKINAEELIKKLHRNRREDPDKFSINSPRDEDNGDNNNNGERRGGKRKKKKKNTNGSDIHIMLPDNISEQMAKGQKERNRLRDVFLGFPQLENEKSDPALTSTVQTSTEAEQEDLSMISHPKQSRGGWEEESPNRNGYHQSTSITSTESTTSVYYRSSNPTKAPKNADDVETETIPKTRSNWAIAWEAHVYFSGTLFVLLAIYCSVNILR